MSDVAESGHAVTGEARHQPAQWSGVFAMTLCVFALVASEFLPVSLLTPIAGDLGVSEGLAGYGIAISGAFAVLASLSIARLAGNMDRKLLLLLLTGLMGVSGLIVGLAPNYQAYLLGRALIGVVVGGFWSMSAAVAMRLVPAASVARALAVFNGGNALATVVAAPLGSYLGGTVGWRGAFLCLVPVSLLALAWQWISLPTMKAAPRPAAGGGHVFSLLKQPLVVSGMLAVGAFFMGQFVLFTYVRPFLETVTRVDFSTLSMVLLVIGIAGLLGTMLIGTLLQWSMYRTLALIPLLMAVIALALTVAGGWLPAVFVLLGLWGLMATAAPTGWWSWLAKALPRDAEAGGGLMVATVQLCIALGSVIGGMLFDGIGYRATLIASAALLLLASLLAWRTMRTQASISEISIRFKSGSRT
ncbi:MFS transporter [Janthinobacterium sp. PSPC3-1]|uniref:MFS transporter n=1 Tax=Janthinobacterium sp. PSPC3-1 TaxID=2804653 RepID=UPI003CE87BCD